MPVLNRENIIDATDGDSAMEAMLYQSFLKTSAEYMVQIQAAKTTEDLGRALHSLKGLALNMGAEALADLCKKAEGGQLDIAQIEAAYQQVCAEMQKIIDSAQ